MNHWLLKSEPGTFSIDDLQGPAQQNEHQCLGRRHPQLSGSNMLRDSMKKGDTAFLYHSSCEVPGIARPASYAS